MRLLSSRPVVATALVALGILLFESWSWELERDHLAGISVPRSGTLDIEVDLPFTPEAFNIQRLQEAGRLVRIQGTIAWIKAVPEDQLVGLARLYWVEQVKPWHAQ